MTRITLEQAARAVVLCFTGNVPVALWGRVGIGKSSILQDVARDLGWRLYDFRLSDKEPSDLGGIPYPQDGRLRYLMNDNLPFDSDEKAVVLLDEFDRCDLAVQNVALQIVLDRSVNAHKLSPNARIAVAGNGVTDMGTTPLTKAAATRMVHLYIESESEGALESYLNWNWAAKNGISGATRSFARYRKEVWTNGVDEEEGKPSAKGAKKKEADGMEELGSPCPRTFDMADRLIQTAKQMKFDTADIVRPVVEGCVGSAAATELLSWHRLCDEAPTIEEIIKVPKTCKLPADLGVFFALTVTMSDYVKDQKRAKHAEAFAAYGLRWPEEQASYLFKRLADNVPNVVTTAPFQTWRKQQEANTRF